LDLHFLIFLQCSTHFIRFSQTVLLFKKLLFTKVPGTFCRFTTIPSVDTKHPGKNRFLAMSSLGVGAARPAGIPASRRRSRLGKVRRRCVSSPRIDLRSKLGQRGARRWCSVAPFGASRRSDCSGEVDGTSVTKGGR
jgi:hypothetical protein